MATLPSRIFRPRKGMQISELKVNQTLRHNTVLKSTKTRTLKQNRKKAEYMAELIQQNAELLEKAEEKQQVIATLETENNKILSEKLTLQQDILKLKEEIEKRKQAAEGHKVKLQDLETDLLSKINVKIETICRLKSDLQNTGDKLKLIKVKNQNLKERNESLDTLNQKLSKQLSVDFPSNISEKYDKLEKENEKLSEKINTLQDELNELQKEKQKVDSKNQGGILKLNEKCSECPELLKKIKTSQDEQNTLHGNLFTDNLSRLQDINDLNIELKQEKEKSAEINSICEKLKQTNSSLLIEVNELKTKLQTHQVNVEIKSETIPELTCKLASLSDEVTLLKEESANFSQKIKILENERNTLLHEKEDIVVKNEERIRILEEKLEQNKVDMCQGEISKLKEQQVRKENSHEIEMQTLKNNLKTANSYNLILNCKLTSSCELENFLRDEMSVLRNEKQEVDCKNQELHETLKMKSSELQNLEEEIKKLRLDHETLKKLIASERAKFSQELQSESESLEVAKSKNNELHKQMETLQKQVEDHKAESDIKMNSIEELREKVQHTNDAVKILRLQVDNLTTEKKKLISEHDMISKLDRAKYEQFVESNTELQSVNEKLRKQLEEITIQKAQKEQISHQQVVVGLTFKDLEAKVKKLEDETKENCEKLKEFEEHLTTLAAQISPMSDTDQRDMLQQREQEISRANETFKELEGSLDKCKSNQSEANALTERLQREKITLQAHLQDYYAQALPQKIAEPKQSLETNDNSRNSRKGDDDDEIPNKKARTKK